MDKVWKSKLDDKYDVFVESAGNGYQGFLVIIANNKELLRETVSIAYAARFGPDAGDVSLWENRCCELIDKLNVIPVMES